MLPAWHLHILVALGFVHLTAAAEPRIFKHAPIVRHLKEPGGGYSPGSPLYHEDARTGDKESGDTRGEKRMGDDAVEDAGNHSDAGSAAHDHGDAGRHSQKYHTYIERAEHEEMAHKLAALLMMVGLFGGPLMALMANSEGRLGERTTALIDSCVTALIALFVYNAFDEIFDLVFGKSEWLWLVFLLHVFFLLFAALALAYWLRRTAYLNAFTAICSYYIASASTHTAGVAHINHFDDPEWQPLYVLSVLALVIGLCTFLPRARKGINDTELLLIEPSMVRIEKRVGLILLSYVVAHAVQVYLGGQVKHFGAAGGGYDVEIHSSLQRGLMLVFSGSCFLISWIMPSDTELKEVMKGAVFRCAGWAVWIYFDWEFYERVMPLSNTHPLFSSCVFGIFITVLCFGIIFLIDFFKVPDKSEAMHNLPVMMGMITGMSVKPPALLSADRIFPGVWGHLILACLAPLLLVPFWLKVIRPKVDSAEKNRRVH